MIIYVTCFDLSGCHQKMDLMMSQSLVRPPRDIINKLIHGVMYMPPSAADLWTCQLEKQRQLYNLELIPYLRTLGIQLLIKIVNTLLLLLWGKSI